MPELRPRDVHVRKRHGFAADASCAPQPIGYLDGNGYEAGKVVGKKFTYEQTTTIVDAPGTPGVSSESYRVKASMAKGKLVGDYTRID